MSAHPRVSTAAQPAPHPTWWVTCARDGFTASARTHTRGGMTLATVVTDPTVAATNALLERLRQYRSARAFRLRIARGLGR